MDASRLFDFPLDTSADSAVFHGPQDEPPQGALVDLDATSESEQETHQKKGKGKAKARRPPAPSPQDPTEVDTLESSTAASPTIPRKRKAAQVAPLATRGSTRKETDAIAESIALAKSRAGTTPDGTIDNAGWLADLAKAPNFAEETVAQGSRERGSGRGRGRDRKARGRGGSRAGKSPK